MIKKLPLIAACLVAICSQSASADVIIGDEYFVTPGLGSSVSGGFFIAASVGNAMFDGVDEVIGTDLNGGNITVSEAVIDNGDGTETIFIQMSTDSGDFFPTGFADPNTGDPLDLAGFFMGANAGGENLDFDSPAITIGGSGPVGVGAAIFGFRSFDSSTAFGYDISGFGNFTAGPGGGWDGSFGVNLGAFAGDSVDIIQVFVTVEKAIPEPTTLGLLSLVGVGLVFRRKR